MSSQLRITVNELNRRMQSGEQFTIIDTRNPGAWAESETTIPGAIRVPVDQLEQNLNRIPNSRPVVAYCT
jgi:rhodanese-related sulfurtransferase